DFHVTGVQTCALPIWGFREFRVRHHGDAARIEVAPAEMERAIAQAGALARELRDVGFERVLLDVEGYRRGALNEGLPLVRLQATDRKSGVQEEAVNSR